MALLVDITNGLKSTHVERLAILTVLPKQPGIKVVRVQTTDKSLLI